MTSCHERNGQRADRTRIDYDARRVSPHAQGERFAATLLVASKAFTALWGCVAVAFASFASLLDNMIEAVNILGSVFYGTVLGIFLVAFFIKRVSATPVLVAAVVAQVVVCTLFFTSDVGFLWYNVVGSAVVVGLSYMLEAMLGRSRTRPNAH